MGHSVDIIDKSSIMRSLSKLSITILNNRDNIEWEKKWRKRLKKNSHIEFYIISRKKIIDNEANIYRYYYDSENFDPWLL